MYTPAHRAQLSLETHDSPILFKRTWRLGGFLGYFFSFKSPSTPNIDPRQSYNHCRQLPWPENGLFSVRLSPEFLVY